MKRPLIMVQQQPYDWEAAKKQVEEIARHFAAYLGEYRSKRVTGSKHAVLGPVGKLLNKAAAGERNLDSLLGYTVRIHEMSSAGGYLSPDALERLRQGAEGLLNLLSDAPVAVRSRLIEQVDDAVYYRHQKLSTFARNWATGFSARLVHCRNGARKTPGNKVDDGHGPLGWI